jgi:hypothetical protein
MPIPDLAADCARCEALCCVALSFEASDAFAFDKPAGRPCGHLTAANACTIHAELAARGMGGCVRYDCQGAGQYVTQHVFGGRSWRREPALLKDMMTAFALVRQIHGMIELLRTADAGLALAPDEAAELRVLIARLAPQEGWTAQALERFDIAAERARVHGFLRTLAPRVPQRLTSRARRLTV